MSENKKNKIEPGIEQYFYRVAAENLKKIPGSPIAYWVSTQVGNTFQNSKPIENYFPVNPGIRTGKDELFLRLWFEVSQRNSQYNLYDSKQMTTEKKWFPLHKGGNFRKWYGNAEHVIDLWNNGENIKTNSPDFRLREDKWYFKPLISWSRISSSDIAFRYFAKGVLFSDAGPGIFADDHCLEVISLLNSKLGNLFLKIINPTLNYQKQDIEAVPYVLPGNLPDISKVIEYAKSDWDSYETSWDFCGNSILNSGYYQPKLQVTYEKLRTDWCNVTLETQRLEEENNRIFIEAYGLQDELTSEIPLNEITLTCNPHYRYSVNKTDEELEAMLLADTMREFISYAVGCMLGRYSLDKPGLILANQGETVADYLKQVPNPSFSPDKDNVIPMLDGDWFSDDIVERFRQFLRVTFGEEHYEENLQFIEQALNIKGKRNYTLRDYFLGEFYADHVKRYKKRPIYWLFSSPKGSFNALIYMHRYRPDTVSVVLNDYLREFRAKLTAHLQHLQATSISAGSSQGDKTRALKEIDKVTKMIAELEDYERDVLYPLATEQIEIDLDDGVKANYPRFGAALKKIPGLDAKDED